MCKGALAPKPPVQNRAAMASADGPDFYASLKDYRGDVVTSSAMRLLILACLSVGVEWCPLPASQRDPSGAVVSRPVAA